MGKRIKVVTKCGEVSFHDFDQDVETVEIVRKAPKLQKRFDIAIEALNDQCPDVACRDCAFELGSGKCGKIRARHILEDCAGVNSRGCE